MLTGRKPFARRRAVCLGRMSLRESMECPPPWIMRAVLSRLLVWEILSVVDEESHLHVWGARLPHREDIHRHREKLARLAYI